MQLGNQTWMQFFCFMANLLPSLLDAVGCASGMYNWMLVFWWRCTDWSFASIRFTVCTTPSPSAPVALVSRTVCHSGTHSYPGSPGILAVKW